MECFLLLSLLALFASGLPLGATGLLSEVSNSTYDYIVVGCGIAGLVVSMRLSEDPNANVLCLEAGLFDNYEEMIQFPVYIGQQPYGFYDWNMTTVPQVQLDGLARTIPMGKGVGGGSLINGMLWNRGKKEEFDAWEKLGNPGWDWNGLFPYFKKAISSLNLSETFTAVHYDGQTSQPMDFNISDHGFSGPVQVSYPEYFWTQSDYFFQALNELGVPTAVDPNDGNGVGGFYIPSGVHPTNQTRSDARRTYYDPYSSRTNLVVLDNSQATRIFFESPAQPEQNKSRATAVEFVTSPNAPRQTVFVSQDVILAAGAVHSPQLLLLSGIGPAQALRNFSIPVLQDLPGVGNNLQDHCMIHLDYFYSNPNYTTPISFISNETFNEECKQEYLTSKTGPWTGRESAAVAFPSLRHITSDSDWRPLIVEGCYGHRELPNSYEETLVAGFNKQVISVLSQLLYNNTPVYEILNNNAGNLDLALMHPLSRGTVQLASTDPFQAPLVDPRWLSNHFDFEVMIKAMQFNQRLLDTTSLNIMQPKYTNGVPQNATADELSELLMKYANTEFHYSGTCAMMPFELGGVVDSNLVVYGTQNLRVVDTSAFPIIPAAHLQSVVYAFAEKAADIVKGYGNAGENPDWNETQPESPAYVTGSHNR